MVKVSKKTSAKIESAEKNPEEKSSSIDDRLIPQINIGTIGHVDHGKTTLVQALTGKWADTHSEEKKRGITIKLGYADSTFYNCGKCGKYSIKDKCIDCMSSCEPVRTVSFVDAPGHETLMATVLSGASLMDGALLVISATEDCPQPQTREHLTVLDISGIKKIIIVQNKVDVVTKEQALKNYKQIKEFLKGTVAEGAPVIPVSAQSGINIDVLIKAIEEHIPTPKRDPAKPPKMLVARSFDINKPGEEIKKLSGGILGGSLVQGQFKVGEEIEIRPGIKIKEKYFPTKSKIVGLRKGDKNIGTAGPGGLLGVMIELDPYVTKADSLTGNVAGHADKLPPVLEDVNLKIHLLERVIGTKEALKVDPIRSGEMLMLTVGTARTVCTVASAGKHIKVNLRIPVCADKSDRIAVSRQVASRWRLVGWAELV